LLIASGGGVGFVDRGPGSAAGSLVVHL